MTSELPDTTSSDAGDHLYASASEALRAVAAGFNDWSAKLTDTSLQMGYAIIASNWLVFGSVNGILKSDWAKFSLLSVLIALGANVIGAWWLAELHRVQAESGDRERARWKQEFEESLIRPSPWPYTKQIELVALWMRRIKAIFTLGGGILLVIGAVMEAMK